jgi:predicted enzyme related to lactoylglutathione lyase
MRLFRCILLVQFALGIAVPLTAALAVQDSLPTLPPITEPASGQYLPGKFVWADLFSSDVEASRRFYEQVFGWEWRPISKPPQAYGLFYLAGEPVAGLAYRKAPDGGDAYGRWIHYLSVKDVSASELAVSERAGRTLLSLRSYPDRGDFAIVTDSQDTPFGIIHAASGDPGDYRAAQGDWIWRELFTRDLGAAVRFYTELFDYAVEQDHESPDSVEYMLESGGYLRAGIGLLSPDSDTAPVWLGYVRVDDVNAALRRALAHGGKIRFEPRPEVANGGLAILADPTGANIGLLHWDYKDAGQPVVQP